ncbi:MAG: DUF4007 family protein [Malacoplasma sp.]
MKISKAKFKGHETFSLREGWIYKCLSELVKDDGNTLFSGINPITRLGVGSNMTKAIRYWIRAFNLSIDNNKGTFLTELGKLVYKYDKYCEDDFTLWLMHINLASNITNATAWHLYFNEYDKKEFKADDLYIFINNCMLEQGIKVSDNSIRVDANMIIKMYSEVNDEGTTPEDNIASPFSRLGLLKECGNKYIREKPDLNTIDKLIILYIISKMIENNQNISIDALEEDEFGVGKLLGISRTDINYYLDLLENAGFIHVVRTAGLNTIKFLQGDLLDSNKIVELYYSNL